ncbi:hypothetical protein [Laribacter hongkongensis]|uniref:hypothetical protein n=1 Tax=Laribacter hongkongensis TaxID=168471 RepID=UPI00126A60E2|nr:hypothetical protein [Laribacter hongkongensis]
MLKRPENRVATNESSMLRNDGLAGQRCADDMPGMIFQPANRLGPDRLAVLVGPELTATQVGSVDGSWSG